MTRREGELVGPVACVEMDFRDRPEQFDRVERFTNAAFDLAAADIAGTANGDEPFLGIGHLGAITSAAENTELAAEGITIQISGIAPENVSFALSQHYQGRPARVWAVFLEDVSRKTPDKGKVWRVAKSAPVFAGRVDNMEVALGKTATLTVRVESRLAEWERPRNLYFTSQTHARLYSGDKFFEYAPQMEEKELAWGRG